MKREETRNLSWKKRDRSGNGTEQGEWTLHITKSFSAKRYGSKEKAYKEAVKFRDEMYIRISRDFQDTYICENVRYVEMETNSILYKYYLANFYEKGVRKARYFSIKKLGKDRALQSAKRIADKKRKNNLASTYITEDDLKK